MPHLAKLMLVAPQIPNECAEAASSHSHRRITYEAGYQYVIAANKSNAVVGVNRPHKARTDHPSMSDAYLSFDDKGLGTRTKSFV
jgi:hypothetical protein